MVSRLEIGVISAGYGTASLASLFLVPNRCVRCIIVILLESARVDSKTASGYHVCGAGEQVTVMSS